MSTDGPRRARADYTDAIERAVQAAHSAPMRPVPAAVPAADPADPSRPLMPAIDRVAAVVWAADAVLRHWDAAGILGLASRRADEVPLLLQAIEALRRALAEGDQ